MSTARRRTRNILATIGLLGVAAWVSGFATYATFTSSTSASQSISTGVVSLNLATPGVDNRLTVSATGIYPGDTMQRAFKLSNSSTDTMASITLTTSATVTSLLDTDATNGLQMVIEKCSVAWIEAGTAPAYTYTCGGTTSTVLATRAIIGTNIALSNLTLTPAATDNLRLTLTLPTTAGNTFQNLTSTVLYTFTATQRAGKAS